MLNGSELTVVAACGLQRGECLIAYARLDPDCETIEACRAIAFQSKRRHTDDRLDIGNHWLVLRQTLT